jgi:hypothetical protein
MASIKNLKLLYHLTCIDNLESILEHRLLPRSRIENYVDVADQGIIESRAKLGLEDYVPFHFFGGSPFDGSVQLGHPDKDFVLITVQRIRAESLNWKVLSRHPLADEEIELLDYSDGIAAIDWDKMDERDYRDDDSKSICMAECLSPKKVLPKRFFNCYVANIDDQKMVLNALKAAGYAKHVNINEGMFVKR